jgi:hypothetical protein
VRGSVCACVGGEGGAGAGGGSDMQYALYTILYIQYILYTIQYIHILCILYLHTTYTC